VDVSKLLALIRRADTSARSAELEAMLIEIRDSCRMCAEFAPRPLSFRVSIPDISTFNSKVALDITWVNVPVSKRQIPLLHVVDVGTHFGAAEILRGESVDDVQAEFVSCWASAYFGMPEIMMCDASSIFSSQRWFELASSVGV
jgi:hypothetical protein